jgi:hypothetical protein
MELLITRSKIPHFYRIDQGELIKIEFENFSEHEIGQPTWKLKRSLPWEITTIILHYLFYNHLSDHNYDLAAAMVSICRQFCIEIYNDVYGRSTLKDVTRVKRMCNTMYTLERIHDDYITMSRLTTYSACRLIKSGIATPYRPWDFVVDAFSTPLNGVVTRDQQPIKQFEVGSLNGDVVWLQGDYDKHGVFLCTRLKHPIINLEICNYADDNMVTSGFLQNNKPFGRFVELLVHCYGINTGVHVMFNDAELGNPFDVSRVGFIEF